QAPRPKGAGPRENVTSLPKSQVGHRYTPPPRSRPPQRRRDEDGLVVELRLDHPERMTTGRIEVEGGPTQFASSRTPPFVRRAYDPSSGDGRALGIFVHSARLVPF